MIHWIPKLQYKEFPAGVVEQMEEDLFNKVLIPLRQRSGVSMTPSPLIEGHVRLSGTSRHSTKDGTRKSDASDFFIPSKQSAVFAVLREAQALSAGGVGLYFDTKPSVMVHVDTRPQHLLWLRVDGEYIYEPNDPVRFYTELLNQTTKLEK